jgi:endonuclease-3
LTEPDKVERIMQTLAREIDGMDLPAMEKISGEHAEDPFLILIGTLLSARTQDATTHEASNRLFRRARTPKAMAALSAKQIEKLIYPVGFYRNKAKFVKATSQALVERFRGRVPGTLEELVTLPGVGRKTANLVLILGFRSQHNICVDTHVHRIANRFGWVRTGDPQQTERALYEAVEARWWPYLNQYLVTWGQNICRPIRPRCDVCPLENDCPRVGVRRTANS